jgi:hypothetical protein
MGTLVPSFPAQQQAAEHLKWTALQRCGTFKNAALRATAERCSMRPSLILGDTSKSNQLSSCGDQGFHGNGCLAVVYCKVDYSF